MPNTGVYCGCSCAGTLVLNWIYQFVPQGVAKILCGQGGFILVHTAVCLQNSVYVSSLFSEVCSSLLFVWWKLFRQSWRSQTWKKSTNYLLFKCSFCEDEPGWRAERRQTLDAVCGLRNCTACLSCSPEVKQEGSCLQPWPLLCFTGNRLIIMMLL